jgi:hypothetical protein
MASKFESEIIEPEERAQAATAPSAPREVDFNQSLYREGS